MFGFKVMSADGKVEVGEVSKKWSGFAQEYFTDADNFKVSFPSDLDVSAKATVLGAVFLIVSSQIATIFAMEILKANGYCKNDCISQDNSLTKYKLRALKKA